VHELGARDTARDLAPPMSSAVLRFHRHFGHPQGDQSLPQHPTSQSLARHALVIRTVGNVARGQARGASTTKLAGEEVSTARKLASLGVSPTLITPGQTAGTFRWHCVYPADANPRA